MRSSSVTDFLLFCNQLRNKSALVRLVGGGGKVVSVVLDGRILAVRPDVLTVKGRGCEICLDLTKAEFRLDRGGDGKVVTLPSANRPPFWEIRFPRGGTFLFGEQPLPPTR